MDEWDSFQTWKIAVNEPNMQPWTADNGWSSSLGVENRANYHSPHWHTTFYNTWHTYKY